MSITARILFELCQRIEDLASILNSEEDEEGFANREDVLGTMNKETLEWLVNYRKQFE